MTHGNSTNVLLSNYEDELKFLLRDGEQLHAVYSFVKDRLLDIVVTEKKQIDSYLDDNDLTLHKDGVSFRIRQSESSGIPPKYSLDLKMKRPNIDGDKEGIYKRREAKQTISGMQLEALNKGASIDQIDPDYYELLCGLISVPSINLEKKFDLSTSRREVIAKVSQNTQITFNFDTMLYAVNGKLHTYYELEIKISTVTNHLPEIIKEVIKKFILTRWGKSKYDRGIYLYKKENDSNKPIQKEKIIERFNLTDLQVKVLDQYRPILDSVYQDFIFHRPYLIREEKRIIDELQALQKVEDDDAINVKPRIYVHSFRSRLKNADHIIAKIVRRADSYFQDVICVANTEEKSLTADNYKSILTDLIGIRVLHLFKDNWLEIDDQLTSLFKDSIVEREFYVRKGDEIRGQDLLEQTQQRGFVYKEKESGYRSAHYLIKRDVFVDSGDMFTTYAEIQVRTVFEEAWGEVDHEIRYPHYDQDININHFLKIFNRIVGSADEMATYIKTYRDSLIL